MILILKAARFAREAHDGQPRKYEGTPYITHPRRVAGRLAEEPWTTEVHVAAGWLHDVVEDCNVSLATIEREFGAEVARIVGGSPRSPVPPACRRRSATGASWCASPRCPGTRAP